MELFIKNKNESIKKRCSTKEEYITEINRIQVDELNSDRYKKVRNSLENYYWNRDNKDLEEELFKIVEIYRLQELLIDKSNEYQKSLILKKYMQLKEFFNSLSEEQINSNVFLKIANLYRKICVAECKKIISQLNIENSGKIFQIEFSISKNNQRFFPNYVSTERAVVYYDPSLYKIDYVNILDMDHINVYYDYNDLIKKITKLAEDIYILELNHQMVNIFNNLICYHFQIYHPGHDSKFIAKFLLNDSSRSINEEKLIVEEDFIETTINNFKILIDLGIVDIDVLQEKKHILKKN